MKKTLILTSLMLLLAIFIVACGNENGNNQSNNSTSNNTLDNKASTDDTRIYTDVAGNEVEIPVHPERVITTQYLDALLALDIKPVGASSHVLDNHYLGELQEGVEDIGHPFDIEKVLSLEPDLIIVSTEEEVEELSKIAPTIVVPWMYGDVYDQFREIAQIVGKEQKAEDWVIALEEKAAEGRAHLTIAEEDIVTIYMTHDKDVLRIYGGRNIGHIIYRLLELTPPDFIQAKFDEDPDFNDFVYDDISMEMLPEYAGDHIIMLTYDNETIAEGGMFYQVEQSALWQGLAAVQNDQLYVIDAEPWFSYSPLAIEAALDEAIELFSN
jgi:iron complex transport system substrate-binding protein